MPKLVNRPPKYRLHRGSGNAVVTLNGRDRYLGPHNTKASRMEYDRLVSEWLAAGRQEPGQSAGITVGELCDGYMTFAEGYYATGSSGELDAFRSIVRIWCKTYLTTPLLDFGPLALKALREKMVEEGWSRKYVNAQIIRVRRMVKWAVGNELAPASVLEALRAVDGLRAGKTKAPDRPAVAPVSEAWVEAVRPHLSTVVRTMLDLQWLTGMRPGEVVTMTTGQIERPKERGALWTYRPIHHKNLHRGHDRFVPLGERAQKLLKPFLSMNPEAPVFSPAAAVEEMRAARAAVRAKGGTPLSCGNVPGSNRKRNPKITPGESYEVTAYRKALWRACDRAFPLPSELRRQKKERKIRGKVRVRLETREQWKKRLTEEQLEAVRTWKAKHRFHPHQVRHAAATRIREAHGLEAAQVLLGHRRLDATQIYAEKNVKAAMKIAREVG